MSKIIVLISEMDKVAQIAAYRGLANSGMARCIGAIRQHLREQDPNYVKREDAVPNINERNEQDENARGDADNALAMGFDRKLPAIELAAKMHAVYDLAKTELQTITLSRWDEAMTAEAMLDFMISKAKPNDPAFADMFAAATGIDVDHINRMEEVIQMQDKLNREQLAGQRDTILATFNGFGRDGHYEALDDLDVINQHQLAVKTVASMVKAKDRILIQALRSRRISELGSLTLLDDGILQLATYVDELEQTHRSDFSEVLETNYGLRTLGDVTLPKNCKHLG